jgi:hypothetical protein
MYHQTSSRERGAERGAEREGQRCRLQQAALEQLRPGQKITTHPHRFHGMALEDNYQSFVLLCI